MPLITILIFLLLVIVPGIPLALSWRRRFKRDPAVDEHSSTSIWLLVTITVSFVWLVVGVLWRPLIGLDYSTRRFSTIYANLAIIVVAGLIALFIKLPEKRLLIGSICAVAIDWLYALVVSSAV
jgi:hypothetical protein